MGNPPVTQHNTILQQYQKVCPGIKVTAKDQLVILGAPLGDEVKCDLLSTKIEELDEISNTAEHLDAHGFYLLRNCFSMPNLYFLRTSTCFAEKDLLKQYDDILKKALSKLTNCVSLILSSLSQFFRPQSGLGVSSAQSTFSSRFFSFSNRCQ